MWQCTGSRNKLCTYLVVGAYICCLERAALSVVMKHHLGETEGRHPSLQHSTTPTPIFFCAKDDKADDADDNISLNHRKEKIHFFISKSRNKRNMQWIWHISTFILPQQQNIFNNLISVKGAKVLPSWRPYTCLDWTRAPRGNEYAYATITTATVAKDTVIPSESWIFGLKFKPMTFKKQVSCGVCRLWQSRTAVTEASAALAVQSLPLQEGTKQQVLLFRGRLSLLHWLTLLHTYTAPVLLQNNITGINNWDQSVKKVHTIYPSEEKY